MESFTFTSQFNPHGIFGVCGCQWRWVTRASTHTHTHSRNNFEQLCAIYDTNGDEGHKNFRMTQKIKTAVPIRNNQLSLSGSIIGNRIPGIETCTARSPLVKKKS